MGEYQQNPHVAVIAFPFGTHAAPLLHLTRRLAAAAPHVTFSFFNTSKSNTSIFGFKTDHYQHQMYKNIKAFDVDDGVPQGYVFTGKRQEDIELFLNVAQKNFKIEIDKVVLETKSKVSCLMSDAFLWFGVDMAKEMNVVWVPFWTAGASALSAHLYTDLIRDTIGVLDHKGKDEEPLTFVPGMSSALRVKDLPLEVLVGNTESVLSRILHKMAQTITTATTITINSFEELDPSVTNDLKSKFHQFLTVGPFNLTAPSPSEHDPHSCISWLRDKRPASVAYVSFGTVTTPPPIELAALAEALEESNVFFIWSIKDNQKVHLPNGFLDRTSGKGMVVPWAPQSHVLGHAATGVFVTHCGWNSVLESLTCGVPMICRPFFGDQRLNGRLVSTVWRIGLGARDGILSKNGVIDAFDLILHKEEGERMRENVEALKNLAGQALLPNGSSAKNFETLLKMVSK